MQFIPIYKKINYSKLNNIANRLFNNYKQCNLCPKNCKVNRFKSNPGACKQTYSVKIASYNLHYGEEPIISGQHGSGTIFFSGCSLSCLFCQNYPISQYNYGNEYTIAKLADIMIKLQIKNAHNINLVTPTHFSPSILKAILLASKKGLNIPVAYNTSGYEKPEIIEAILNFVDIFLFDIKYFDNKLAVKYSNAYNYFKYSFNSFKKIFETLKDKMTIENRVLKRGLIVRHLVLPQETENSKIILKKIASISKNIHISLMSQYFPAYNAYKFKNLSRKLFYNEYEEVVQYAINLGLKNVLIQKMDSF